MKENNVISFFKQGNEKKGVEILYKEVFPAIKKYVQKNGGDISQAEDLFHDVVIKMLVRMRGEGFDEVKDLNAYLFTIAKNLWISKAKRDSKVSFSDEMGSYEKGADLNIKQDQEEKSRLMDEMLNSLGEMCRELLKLTFYLDFSLKEAAEKLGISSAEVAKTNQYRCKKKLFSSIKENRQFRELMNI